MLQSAAPLISKSDEIRAEYELNKAYLHPDQQTIIKFRHGILDLFLRIYELVWSIGQSLKCENVITIQANTRQLLLLHSTSTEVLKIWKQTIRNSFKHIFSCVGFLANMPKLTECGRIPIEELLEWTITENGKWDIPMTSEELGTVVRFR